MKALSYYHLSHLNAQFKLTQVIRKICSCLCHFVKQGTTHSWTGNMICYCQNIAASTIRFSPAVPFIVVIFTTPEPSGRISPERQN